MRYGILIDAFVFLMGNLEHIRPPTPADSMQPSLADFSALGMEVGSCVSWQL